MITSGAYYHGERVRSYELVAEMTNVKAFD